MQGVVLPARTPKPIVDRWHTEVAKIVALPEIRDRLIGFGLEPVANTPQEFEAWIKAEIEKWGEGRCRTPSHQSAIATGWLDWITMRIVDIRETAIPLKFESAAIPASISPR